jgi:hypothetical protein
MHSFSTNVQTARARCQRVMAPALLLALIVSAGAARGQEPAKTPGGDLAAPDAADVSETGKKLSNPLSDVWAMFTEFDLNTSDGKATSSQRVGSRMVFQPILPIPLFGDEGKEWRFITRPTIPVLFSEPVPTGPGMFDHKQALGDMQVPMVISPPVPNWILGAGPTWLFPTATENALGRQQWGVGPAVVVGHYSDKLTLGVFPQYFLGIGRQGRSSEAADASYLNMLYFMFYNLPNAWQIGFSPTITYDRRANAGDRWNVPVGVSVSKTTRVGRLITKFELGFEYSVVHQDSFGQRGTIKLSVIPVIPSLIRKPLLARR